MYRETALPGAVLTRVAASHIRVGTFQFFAARGDAEAVRLLADYAIARHYPEAAGAESPYRALLDGVVARQAELVARWLLVGFVHGVMNTDNTSIAGETIDYGPCAFLDAYDPAAVFSSIDQLRALRLRQPAADRAVEPGAAGRDACCRCSARTRRRRWLRRRRRSPPSRRASRRPMLGGLRRKIGLSAEREGDADAGAGPAAAHGGERRRLHAGLPPPVRRGGAGPEGDAAVRALFADPAAYDAWAARWRERLAEEPGAPSARAAAMRAVNPAVIPRNHLVEAALSAAAEREDFGPFEELLDVLSRPFEDRPGLERYAMPPRPEERVLQTFCGT